MARIRAAPYPGRTLTALCEPAFIAALDETNPAGPGPVRPVEEGGHMATAHAAPVPATDRDAADAADLARYGYKQELKRSLNIFSSFAVAFSYISPATGIFTLFILGVGTLGGAFFWTWPVVWLGQFIVALVFAEVSTHFPLACSVFQWTKYLTRNQTSAWYAGWV